MSLRSTMEITVKLLSAFLFCLTVTFAVHAQAKANRKPTVYNFPREKVNSAAFQQAMKVKGRALFVFDKPETNQHWFQAIEGATVHVTTYINRDTRRQAARFGVTAVVIDKGKCWVYPPLEGDYKTIRLTKGIDGFKQLKAWLPAHRGDAMKAKSTLEGLVKHEAFDHIAVFPQEDFEYLPVLTKSKTPKHVWFRNPRPRDQHVELSADRVDIFRQMRADAIWSYWAKTDGVGTKASARVLWARIKSPGESHNEVVCQ